MRFKNLLLLCVFIFLNTLTAQTIELTGKVKDSLQKPLTYANVLAKPLDKNQNIKFAITDDYGLYKLTLKQNQNYTITVSYLGYKPNSFTLKTKVDSKKDFILKEAPNQLEEVVIELPIIVKKDTTIYNVSKFTDGKERKLKESLKKLPGVEVEKDGTVYVKGKKITKMMVEGKNFFGGGTKLAIENIPANAVDKVQVIENYNEIPFLKNIVDSDETAMNIELKEDKKQFVFGDIEAGKSNNEYYNAHSNLFYYSPKTNLNFIGNLNNAGKKTFTFKDYMNFQGGISSVFSGKFKFRRGDFSQFMENKDLTKSTHQFGALHLTQETSKNLDVSGYAIFSGTNNHSLTKTNNQYTNFTEKVNLKQQAKNRLGIANLVLDYTPNTKEKWYSTTQYKTANNNNSHNINTLINTNAKHIETQKEATSHYFQQNIEWHKKQNLKHTFSFTANAIIDKNNPTTLWKTNQAILQGLLPVITEENYKLHQLKTINNTNLNTIFKHFWILNNSNHIYTTLSNTYTNEKFSTYDYQELKNGTKNEFSNADFNNDVYWKLNDLSLGLHYKFRIGIGTFKQGITLHRYNWSIDANKHQKTVFSPDFMAKIEFSSARNLSFNYNLNTRFSGASDRANKYFLNSYNSIYKGNNLLENELYHYARLWYSRFSLYRGLMLSASISYTKKIKGIQNTVRFNNQNRYLTPEMVNNPEESVNARVDWRKKIKKLQYKFRTNISTTNFLQKIDNKFVNNKSNRLSYRTAIKTLYDNFPTIEVGFRQKYGTYTSSNSSTKFVTTEPFTEIEYNFLKYFSFSFDYNYYHYQNKTLKQKNTYQLANTSLQYKKENSAWSFKIEAQNLFNEKFKQSNRFSSYLISDTKTYILPRIVMFSIGYNL